MAKLLFVIVLFFLYINHVISADEDNEKEKFVPTHEWQVVQPGQPIPAGLHVRHNFEKKITEAKLLDDSENDDTKTAISAIPNEEISEDTEKSNYLSREKLKEAIEKMNEDEEVYEPSPEDVDRVKSKFRSYDELKKEFSALNLTIKTDAEIMIGLMNHFVNLSSQRDFDNTEELKTILVDFEYLVHQIDNAMEFVKMQGFEKIIFPSVNFTDDSLKIEALKILSATVQHNPKAQIYAYEAGSIPFLINYIRDGTWKVRISALSATNNLLRRFPMAQWKFIESEGLKAFPDLLAVHDFQLYSKLVTLFTDILIDHADYLESQDKQENKQHPSEMIKSFLQNEFNDGGWCLVVANAFINNIEVREHDFMLKILNLMNMTKSTCNKIYNHDSLKHAIDNLVLYYQRLSEKELHENKIEGVTNDTDDVDFYFTNMKDSIINITNSIYESTTEYKVKDEL